MPKYSIMVPSYNGIQYLPSCINSILNNNYSNYELIISDDHSTDGTVDYLKTLDNQNITILSTPNKMSMAEHWEWILRHAQGEWYLFVGQDDGIQHYFFELADILTGFAKEQKIRSITCERAYYFYPGCPLFGDSHISFEAMPKSKICDIKKQILKSLNGDFPYFILPQMYTTSMFHKSLIEESKSKQNGNLFCTHPQDANLVAISCGLENRYLHSYLPFAWVGTSPKSAGLATSDNTNKELKKDYITKINTSAYKYCDRIGDFSIASTVLYLWGALLETKQLQDEQFYKKITSKCFTYKIIAAAYNELRKSKEKAIANSMLAEVKIKNNINNVIFIMFLFTITVSKIIKKPFNLVNKIARKISKIFCPKKDRILIKYTQKDFKTMDTISKEIVKIVKERNFINLLPTNS